MLLYIDCSFETEIDIADANEIESIEVSDDSIQSKVVSEGSSLSVLIHNGKANSVDFLLLLISLIYIFD
jgi:hypothetical protein